MIITYLFSKIIHTNMKSPITKIISLLALFITFCFSAKAQNTPDATQTGNMLFSKGEKIKSANFTGTVWLNSLVVAEDRYDCVVGNVTFEAGARTNWHSHPDGQILLATEGIGYYQEKGKPIRILHKGDVVKGTPNVPHWHGASPGSGFTHIAITANNPNGRTLWLQKVTEQEYNSVK